MVRPTAVLDAHVRVRSRTDRQQVPRSIVGLLKEAGGRTVEAVAADARDRDLSAASTVLRGLPEAAILQYADGVDADLVAMGTRGASATDDRFLGSTTARVLRRTSVPVLAVS